MEKILISACFLGHKVRYDGEDSSQHFHPIMAAWKKEGRLVTICPEVAGGLPVPRDGCEIIGGGGEAVLNDVAKVFTKTGKDFSKEYIHGAEQALALVKQHQIKIAVLKNRSPSCGSEQIYNGTFSRTPIDGEGVTAALLRLNGVRLFHEDTLEQAQAYLAELSMGSGLILPPSL